MSENNLFDYSKSKPFWDIAKNGKPCISISQVLGLIQEPFDADAIIDKNFDKWQSDPSSKYYGKTKDEIKESWSSKGAESCSYGSLLDNYIGLNLTKTKADIEIWKLDNNYEYDKKLFEHCKAFDDFYALLKKSGDTIFVEREKTVFLDMGDFLVKGRFDALFYNTKTKTYIIIDWKSSGSIDKTYTKWTKKLLGPCTKFPALNYYTYTLQLYFYKKALVKMGYLPEGTSFDNVKVMIVNLPDHLIESTGQHFETHSPAFAYDDELMDRLFKFAFQKNNILKDKDEASSDK